VSQFEKFLLRHLTGVLYIPRNSYNAIDDSTLTYSTSGDIKDILIIIMGSWIGIGSSNRGKQMENSSSVFFVGLFMHMASEMKVGDKIRKRERHQRHYQIFNGNRTVTVLK